MNPGTIIPDPNLPLSRAVNEALCRFIGPFEASTARLLDNAGNTTDEYAVVLRPGGGGDGPIPIDSVAAVIVCDEELTIEGLRAAYERVQQAKALAKTKGMDASREMTVGLIVARHSQLPLETISDEMSRLTTTIPSHQWPDAVSVLSKGIINYTARDPAGVAKAGDFLLPASSLIGSSTVPSVFVDKTIRAAGDRTFNKIISIILARISIFQPETVIPSFQDFIKGIPAHGISTETYQFDLTYSLRAMTTEQTIMAQLPRARFDVMNGKKVLGSIQYLPWQDGAVLFVRGDFPIEMLLLFLRAIKPDINPGHLQAFRGPHLQVSFVLPITWPEFNRMLGFFQSRSNMRIERRDPKGVIQKFGDEGTTTPFVARLMLGVMQIRDAVHNDAPSRLRFDELYDPVMSGLRDAREASKEIEKLWKDHQRKVESGTIARVLRGTIYVDEHIDRPLKRNFDSFLNTAIRVIKQSMQALAEHYGVDIGFLFKKQSTFEAAIEALKKTDSVRADYLNAARNWSEPLVLMRNDLEHGVITTPKVTYIDENGRVRASEPAVDGKPITDFTGEVLDRVCCFAEEMTMYCLKKKLPQSLDITEQPLADREERAPLRFHLCVVPGGRPPWELSAHGGTFDQT